MYDLSEWIDMLDYTLDTKMRRHIFGGTLLSMSLMFGGIAFTILTVKEDKK